MFTPCIVNHPTTFRLTRKSIEQIFHEVSLALEIPQKGTINIAFLSDEQIQNYNRVYRSIDSNTDVLSFHYHDEFRDLKKQDIAGEIIMSESKVISQSLEHAHTSEIEAKILILHGVLHILGFDHETDEEYKEMWGHELNLRKKAGLYGLIENK